jgi:hypothetical protein
MPFECENCGAMFGGKQTRCSVCGQREGVPSSSVIRFTSGARDASDGLGGIVALHSMPIGKRVRFVAQCPGGVFGVDQSGELVWRDDWDFVVSVVLRAGVLRVNDIAVDPETGKRTR